MEKGETKEYFVNFRGIAKVKAKNMDHAKNIVLVSKNIKTYESIEVKSNWELFFECIFQNVGAIMTLFMMIVVLKSWSDLLNYVQTLPEAARMLPLLAVIGLMMLSIRFPKIIGGWFNFETKRLRL